jgi:hypothetical protein
VFYEPERERGRTYFTRNDKCDGLDRIHSELVRTHNLTLGGVDCAAWDETHPALWATQPGFVACTDCHSHTQKYLIFPSPFLAARPSPTLASRPTGKLARQRKDVGGVPSTPTPSNGSICPSSISTTSFMGLSFVEPLALCSDIVEHAIKQGYCGCVPHL